MLLMRQQRSGAPHLLVPCLALAPCRIHTHQSLFSLSLSLSLSLTPLTMILLLHHAVTHTQEKAKEEEAWYGVIPPQQAPWASLSLSLSLSLTHSHTRTHTHTHTHTDSVGKEELFKDVTLVVERGERVALLGPNGCGL